MASRVDVGPKTRLQYEWAAGRIREIGAAPYERTDTRTNERNGWRLRLLATLAGDIEFAIPKLRRICTSATR